MSTTRRGWFLLAALVIAGCKGESGAPGTEGVPGTKGDPGEPGASVAVTALEVGSGACAFGGARFDSASGTAHACNGAPGPAGAQGAPGAQGERGVAGTSVTATRLLAGDPSCPNGGVQLASGSGTAEVCNGARGPQGVQGPVGPVRQVLDLFNQPVGDLLSFVGYDTLAISLPFGAFDTMSWIVDVNTGQVSVRPVAVLYTASDCQSGPWIDVRVSPQTPLSYTATPAPGDPVFRIDPASLGVGVSPAVLDVLSVRSGSSACQPVNRPATIVYPLEVVTPPGPFLGPLTIR